MMEANEKGKNARVNVKKKMWCNNVYIYLSNVKVGM